MVSMYTLSLEAATLELLNKLIHTSSLVHKHLHRNQAEVAERGDGRGGGGESEGEGEGDGRGEGTEKGEELGTRHDISLVNKPWHLGQQPTKFRLVILHDLHNLMMQQSCHERQSRNKQGAAYDARSSTSVI